MDQSRRIETTTVISAAALVIALTLIFRNAPSFLQLPIAATVIAFLAEFFTMKKLLQKAPRHFPFLFMAANTLSWPATMALFIVFRHAYGGIVATAQAEAFAVLAEGLFYTYTLPDETGRAVLWRAVVIANFVSWLIGLAATLL